MSSVDSLPLPEGKPWGLPPLLDEGQFWREGTGVYCFRPSCEGCQFLDVCQHELTYLKVGPGINIRRAFRAKPGFLIVAIDYAAIELRVAAELSGEPFWVRAFQAEEDLHTNMAKVAFKTQNPTKAQRDSAKKANFGNLYLGSAETLCAQSDLTLPEASFIWTEWWKAVPVYKSWTEAQFVFAKQNGYVSTFFGRRRRLDDLILAAKGEKKGKKMSWGFIRRTSVNSPVQGTSADLIKMAMLRVSDWIEKEHLEQDIQMLLSVHDELVFQIRDDENLCSRARTIADLMTRVPPNWKVPLKTDIEVGPNWAELEDIKALEKRRGIEPRIGQAAVSARPKEFFVVSLPVQDYNTICAVRTMIEIAKANSSEGVRLPVLLEFKGSSEAERLPCKCTEPALRKALSSIYGVRIR